MSSIQETNLTEIADAIREKEGTTDPISADQFADRVRNLQLEPTIPEDVYKIELSIEPPEGGAVTGGGYAKSGMEVIVEAEANEGYKFDGWKQNNSIVGANKEYSFKIYANTILISQFSEKPSFEWGSNGEFVDAEWFTNLKNYLLTNSGASLGNILGTTKSVTLTTPVLGTTTHLIQVIGVDQDADNTITFQTANCLNEATIWSTTSYSSSNTTAARWIDPNCKAKKECINYYNAFPGKLAIKTVKKGTCDSTNVTKNETPTYRDETVFLLSEREFGLDNYSPLSVNNSTTLKSECTQGENFSYQYYIDNNTRIKKLGDSGSNVAHWERSRYFSPSSVYPAMVCYINGTGQETCYYYHSSNGISPAFVIGN